MKTTFAISFLVFLFTSGIAKKSSGIFFSFKPDSIQVQIDPDQLMLPGESFEMGVVSFHKKGKTRKTLGMQRYIKEQPKNFISFNNRKKQRLKKLHRPV